MFSAQIVTTDAFLEMPLTTQALYFHLGMSADDDGFVSPRKVLRMTGAGEDDLKVLLAKGFVIPFQSGVIVITHWKQNNYLRNDRYTPTIYKAERENLSCIQGVYRLDTVGIPNGYHSDTCLSPCLRRERGNGCDINQVARRPHDLHPTTYDVGRPCDFEPAPEARG